jgi:hypothetical protein
MFVKSETYLDAKPSLQLAVRDVDANGDEPLRVQPLRSNLPTPWQDNNGLGEPNV